MKNCLRSILLAALMLTPCMGSTHRHDPLTAEEIDQLREVALEPEKRLKLLADFARLRLTAIEDRKTPKKPTAESPRSLHDLMDDFLDVYDELDENIGMYEDRRSDLRQALKPVLLADSEFHARVEGLQHNLTPHERTECDFVLSSIVEAIATDTVEHKKLLAEQEVSFKNKKKN